MRLSELRKKLLKNPEFASAYYELQWDIANEASQALTLARIQSGLTQEELARKMKTKQPAIARAEGGSITPSLTFMNEAGKAMGLVLDIKFKKPQQPQEALQDNK